MGLDNVLMPSIYDDLLEAYGPTTTPDEVAKPVLHMHPSTARRLCAEGKLPGVKIGKQWIIPTARLAAMLEGGEAHVG